MQFRISRVGRPEYRAGASRLTDIGGIAKSRVVVGSRESGRIAYRYKVAVQVIALAIVVRSAVDRKRDAGRPAKCVVGERSDIAAIGRGGCKLPYAGARSCIEGPIAHEIGLVSLHNPAKDVVFQRC